LYLSQSITQIYPNCSTPASNQAGFSLKPGRSPGTGNLSRPLAASPPPCRQPAPLLSHARPRLLPARFPVSRLCRGHFGALRQENAVFLIGLATFTFWGVSIG